VIKLPCNYITAFGMEGATIMAHLMKSTRGATGGLTRHFERYKNEKGEYLKFGNQEIDIQKTNLNYNLAEEKNQLEFIKKRTSEVRCLNRKDVNVMASWVITLPESIKTQEDQRLFFEESYNFLEKKYGKENVISSYVHLDETTPHMHFAFIPVVRDKKRGDLKVSAKECITRNDLKQFHPQLEAHMKRVFGREIGILNEKTKEGNKAIDELKRGTAQKELDSLKIDLQAFKDELAMLDIAEDEIRQLGQIQGKEKLFKKDYVEIKKDIFEQFKNMAKNYRKDTVILKKNNDILKNKVHSLEKKVDQLTIEKSENVKRMNLAELREKAETRNKITGLEKQVDTLSNYIINKGLADDFNKSIEQQKSKSRTWEMKR
jgi:hypothetical protein